jgi:hypothetical protein
MSTVIDFSVAGVSVDLIPRQFQDGTSTAPGFEGGVSGARQYGSRL